MSAVPCTDTFRHEAWIETAFHAYHGIVRSLALRIVRSEVDADDIVQETFLKLWTRPPADLHSSLRPWLATVARNLAIDRLRRRRWTEPLEDADVATAAHTSAAHAPDAERLATDRRMSKVALLFACESLPTTQRGVLMLTELFDLSSRDTCAVLGISEGSVKVLAHRARRSLQLHRGGEPAAEGSPPVEALRQLVSLLAAHDPLGLATRSPDPRAGQPVFARAGAKQSIVAVLDIVVDAVATAPVDLRARALWCRGNLQLGRGQLADAHRDLGAARALLKGHSDVDLRLAIDVSLAVAYVGCGQTLRGCTLLQDWLVDAGDLAPHQEVAVRTRLAEALLHLGRREEAKEQLDRAATRSGSTWEPASRVAWLLQVGHHAIIGDQVTDADSAWAEARALAHQLGDPRSEACACANLGVLYGHIGDAPSGRAMLWRAVLLAREADYPAAEAMALGNLAMLEQDQRALAEAVVHYEQAIRLARMLRRTRNVGVLLFNLGVCELLRGRPSIALARMESGQQILKETKHEVMGPYSAVFLAAARVLTGGVSALPELERARNMVETARWKVGMEVLDVLDGLRLILAGQTDLAQARIRRAGTETSELRTAVHLVQNALESPSFIRTRSAPARPEPSARAR